MQYECVICVYPHALARSLGVFNWPYYFHIRTTEIAYARFWLAAYRLGHSPNDFYFSLFVSRQFLPFVTCAHFLSIFCFSYYRAPPSPILPHGVGALYSPSASFQSLLANISAAQHSAQHSAHQSAGKPITSHSEFLTSIAASSPPLSPPISVTAGGNNSTSGSASPPDDRRSSSIAALRLKAREHEIRLEMLRQNGHNDIISWIRCAFNGSE